MSKTILAYALVSACVILAWGCAASNSESSPPSPRATWPTAAPEEQGFDSALLAQLVEEIDLQGLPVDSLQLVRNGVLIVDAYFSPYREDQAHDVASVTKSITSTLVGIAIDQGRMTLDSNVLASFPDLVPTPPTDGKTDINLGHLLTMTSGLDCGRTPGEPELREMMGSEDFVEYALDLPMAVAPGTEFAYCSPGSHLLSAMITEATGLSALDFALANLFGPLGILDAEWAEDPQGVNHGWGDLRLHPRDLARIGQLFLNEGAWNDMQVVSKDWVAEATRSWVTVDIEGTGYGYQWWVLAGGFEGLYEALGNGGQAMIVWPDRQVVAVFTGRGVDVLADVAPRLAAALRSDAALDPNPDAETRLNEAIRNATAPPPATPVPPLPPMATAISGKVYRLDPNPFDVQCISLHFASRSEVEFELSLGSGIFDLPVGMDGIPRFLENGPTEIPVGVLGAWTEPTVFSMSYDEVGGTNHLRIRGVFDEGAQSAALEFSDPGEYFPPQTFQATSVDQCN